MSGKFVTVDIDWGGDRVQFTARTGDMQVEFAMSPDTAEALGAPLAWAVAEVRRFQEWLAAGHSAARFQTAGKPIPGPDPRVAYVETTRHHQDKHAEAVRELERTRDEIRRLVDKVDATNPNRTLIADLRQIANGGRAEWTL